MNVMLHCDNSETKNDFLGVFHLSGNCQADIFLRSPLACLPVADSMKNQKCFVKNPSGNLLSFVPLQNTNHKAAGPNGTTFMIGICNPTLYGHENACEAGTSVCLFDPKATDPSSRYKNMGIMTQDFKLERDVVSLTMVGSEPCAGTDKKYSSRILFECDPLAKSSYPTYHSTVNCVHIFSWPTDLACVEKKSCKVLSAQTGIGYDFSALAGIQYQAVNKNNSEETILFSICSQADEPCMKNTGSCVVKNSNRQSTQAGIANDELKLDGKNPFLLYDNGAVCKQQGKKFTTRIDFICADNVADEGAIAIEDGCAITIHYKTLLACNYTRNCIAKNFNDELIDLRPLINFEGNYVAEVNKKALPAESAPVQYLLNVCRPLNSKYSLNCRGSAGACRTKVEANGKHEEEMSLGHPDYSLITSRNGDTTEVTMRYFNGGACPTDPKENATTKIRFFCNETAGYGNPMLQSIDACDYVFDFPTNILCNERSILVRNDSCSLVNEKVSVSIDLKLFGTNGVFKAEDKDVDICSGPEAKFYTIVYNQSLVRVEYSMKNGNGEFKIIFIASSISLI